MKRKLVFKRIIYLLLLVAIGFGLYYVWFAFPIISGFGAKNACSCIFIQGRTKEDVMKKELGSFPLSLGSIDVDLKDSSVSGSVLGLARRKAIYRNGLGCTLISDYPEATVRAQTFQLPPLIEVKDTSAWLTSNSQIDSLTTPFNQAALDKAMQVAFADAYGDKAPHTSAVLIVLDGKVVAEKYAPGYGAETPFLGWSMAKSVTGALIGILVKEGKLDITKPAPISAWTSADDNRKKITLEHLLQQTSGLNFIENYSSYSSATNMLFYKGNMAGYVAGLPQKVQPGLQFYYSSGNSNLLSQIIRQTVGNNSYHSFPYTQLFHKIGMHHTLLEPDASGTFVGSSYIHASARDYARFGLLYLNNGVWNGDSLLPANWAQASVTPPPSNKLKNYGYQFWLNGYDEDEPQKKAYPEAPADMFMANGYGGQRIYIIPSKRLVMVRLGVNRFDEHQFLKTVLEAIP